MINLRVVIWLGHVAHTEKIAYKIFIKKKSERKRTFGRPRCIRIILKSIL